MILLCRKKTPTAWTNVALEPFARARACHRGANDVLRRGAIRPVPQVRLLVV